MAINGASYALDTIARLEAKCQKQAEELKNLRANVKYQNQSLDHLRKENEDLRDRLIAALDKQPLIQNRNRGCSE